jgi:hypothetical protein
LLRYHGPLVKRYHSGLTRRPSEFESQVDHHGGSRWRFRRPHKPYLGWFESSSRHHRRVAQLEEHHLDTVKASSSNLLAPTTTVRSRPTHGLFMDRLPPSPLAKEAAGSTVKSLSIAGWVAPSLCRWSSCDRSIEVMQRVVAPLMSERYRPVTPTTGGYGSLAFPPCFGSTQARVQIPPPQPSSDALACHAQ